MPLFTRRGFLITGAAVGGVIAGGLVLGVGYLSTVDMEGLDGFTDGDGAVHLNAYIAIRPDGKIIFASPHTEMGQGIHTGIAMLIAEELDVDLSDGSVSVEHPVEELPVYTNYTLALRVRPEDAAGPLHWVGRRVLGLLPVIGTGGSSGIKNTWHPLRVAGASARSMLLRAAAARWNAPVAECRTENGKVLHDGSGRSASYGDLAIDAAALAPGADVALKQPAQWRYIGKGAARLDIPPKVRGEAQFGIDVRQPGMLYAALRQAPVFGGRVARLNSDAVRGRKGVLDVADLGTAVAVAADSYWRAQQAVDALEVTFDDGGNGGASSETIREQMMAGLKQEDADIFYARGDMDVEISPDARSLEAVYEAPLATHACMEPMNATVRIDADGNAEAWASSQSPLAMRYGVKYGAALSGVTVNSVTNHVMLNGGGFGRRCEMDFMLYAAAMAARHIGKPVQMIWSRQQDIANGVYRSHAASKLRAALGADGLPVAWDTRVAAQSLMQSFGARNLSMEVNPEMDEISVESTNLAHYALPNLRVRIAPVISHVPIGFWRVNGHSFNNFFGESFVDECALLAGVDPFEYRRKLLRNSPRHLHVLETAAKFANWGTALPQGSGRGIAICESFDSIVAHTAEVSVTPDGALKIGRIICVADCGFAVNPDAVMAQMQGGTLYGLSTALHAAITLKNGAVEQSNFHDYPVIQMADAPHIDVHIIASTEKPGGAGEPGVPSIAAALGNAVFAATGKRVRSLPFNGHDLSWS